MLQSSYMKEKYYINTNILQMIIELIVYFLLF